MKTSFHEEVFENAVDDDGSHKVIVHLCLVGKGSTFFEVSAHIVKYVIDWQSKFEPRRIRGRL